MIKFASLLFITFIFYSFLGWCYEMIHMSITTKEVVNRGFFNGPIVPIYGVGSCIILILLDNIKSNVVLTVICITVICSVLEYLTSYFMEKKYKIRWWDYTDKKFNLNGRICPETMIQFVIMGLIVLYYVEPIFYKFLLSLDSKTIYLISAILLILFLTDYIFSNYVLKKFLSSDIGERKDKTPAIREFTKSLIASKTFHWFKVKSLFFVKTFIYFKSLV